MLRIVLHTIISKVCKMLTLGYVNGRSVDFQKKHGVKIKCHVTGHQRTLVTNRCHLVSVVSCFWKQGIRYFAGSPKCSTKPLSKLWACILSAVKTGLQSYCDTSYFRGGVNQMWILKNSKDLLQYIQSRSLSSCNSIKTFDFSTQPFTTLSCRTN